MLNLEDVRKFYKNVIPEEDKYDLEIDISRLSGQRLRTIHEKFRGAIKRFVFKKLELEAVNIYLKDKYPEHFD